ncbi:MAG: hypothetical protein HQ517_09330 [SAR324 cluster bacterium]|nr:hypothetical protein [SAR324 cluster bacterium]
MKSSWCLLLTLLLGLGFYKPLQAQQTKTYQGRATVPILENDIAFAKNHAFRQAQQNIISTAIEELIEPQIFEEYHNQILRNKSLRPKHHLVSVTILNEYREQEEFSIELEAKIQIDTLNDSLKQMDLVFKNEPFFPITLLIKNTLDFPIELLSSRLEHFHIRLDKVDKVSLDILPDVERQEKAFTEDLFRSYPQNRIIYLLEPTLENQNSPEIGTSFEKTKEVAAGRINGFKLRILRKSDLEEINTVSLKLSNVIPENSSLFKEKIAAAIQALTKLLTINSVKRNLYEIGLDSSYFIDVSGLNAPYLRSAFELRVLKEKESIRSFSLVQLAVDKCRYLIHSNFDLKVSAQELQETNPYFEILIEDTEFNTIHISVFYHFTATGTKPETWNSDEETIQNIKESILDSKVEIDAANSEAPLHPFYIPTLIEKEPNNSNIQYNRVPASTYLLGKIRNRGDEDIFEFKGVELSDRELELKYFQENHKEKGLSDRVEGEAQVHIPAKEHAETPMNGADEGATIYLDWIQIGKTALTPQLRLYDENFNFIHTFKLSRSKKRHQFSYTFSTSSPEKIYFRIADKVGFIQGETGGFKLYQYMIRYSWTDERAMEPDSPFVAKIQY